jgi:ankyrin repeat protein
VRRIGCLLEHGADQEQRNPYNGKRAYENAMLAGDVDVAELLVRHGAVRRELAGHDAFVAACMRGDEAAARELLRGEYLDDAEPLVAASGAGKIDAVRVLLDLGIDPDRPGKHEKRALHVASGDGGDAAIVALLLERGADPRSRCYGGTACDWAVMAGRGALARMLAERSRMPHDAARSGHVALLAEVLREDATAATSVDANGNTPLHRLPEDVEAARAVIELLVAHGAELDARNGEGRTPAEVARRRGLDDHAELLAANSAP